MWKRLVPLSTLMVGTGLTISCASFGLAWLLMIVSGPARTAPAPDHRKTVLIHVENVDADEVAARLRRHTSDRGDVGVNRPEQMVRITDLPAMLHSLRRIVHQMDRPLASAPHVDEVESYAGAIEPLLAGFGMRFARSPEDDPFTSLAPEPKDPRFCRHRADCRYVIWEKGRNAWLVSRFDLRAMREGKPVGDGVGHLVGYRKGRLRVLRGVVGD